MTKVKVDNTIDIDVERKNSLRHDVDVALFSVALMKSVHNLRNAYLANSITSLCVAYVTIRTGVRINKRREQYKVELRSITYENTLSDTW